MTLNINKMKIMVKMNTRKLKELLMERIGRIEENWTQEARNKGKVKKKIMNKLRSYSFSSQAS